MLNLAEYRPRPDRLSDHLPWAALVAPGIVLNKDGSLQRTIRYRGPDLESATEPELVAICARLNDVLRRLGSGWALFFEATRRPAGSYPESTFPDPLTALIDAERRAEFEESGTLFECTYALTLCFLPPEDRILRGERLLIEATGEKNPDQAGEMLGRFRDRTDRIVDLLGQLLPEAVPMEDAETLTYLHGCISDDPHAIAVPEVPVYLDAVLADTALAGGLAPRLGSAHLRILSVLGYPGSTTPGLLDELNHLGLPYRWVTRFIALDKPEAERLIRRVRRQWFAKRKSVAAIVKEVLTNEASVLVDSDADNKTEDADLALQELGQDLVAYGYATTTVTVWDSDPSLAAERARAVRRVIDGRGFATILEDTNAVEAWLSSLPGQSYANVRQAPISTLNLAHMMPLSATWAGPARNTHLDGPPLLTVRTNGTTPFRLVTHAGDVGHTLVVGPTGAGKSVFLALLILQFRRYPGARITIFDKGASARAAILGAGGSWTDLGPDGDLALQPLARIDETPERAAAADWVQALFLNEGIAAGPEMKEAIWSALTNLAAAPSEERTLTGLATLLQRGELRQALHPYTLDGPHGQLLDAETDRLTLSELQGIEMEGLMQRPALVPPVLLHLFHRLEQRFTGAPALLILDEAWLFLDSPLFAARLRDWLKTLRKKNVSVVFATQSLADIATSAIAPAILESCPTRIFLPNDRTIEPQLRSAYEGFGLNARQIELIARAVPKRDYYVHARDGTRMIDLALGPVALAFAAAGTQADQSLIDELIAAHGAEEFADSWLRARGLDWAAELLPTLSTGDTL